MFGIDVDFSFPRSTGLRHGGGVRAFIVDAFTDRAFAGNPAAVCLGTVASGDRFGDVGWMPQVAAEFNLSETAFLAGGPRVYDLRWFTPQ